MPTSEPPMMDLMRPLAADPDMLARGLERFETFAERARREHYPLAPASHADEATVRTAINACLDPEAAARNVVFMSAGAPFPRPIWMTKHHYREALRHLLRGCLGERIRSSAANALPGGAVRDLCAQIEPRFGRAFETALRRSYPCLLRNDSDDQLRHAMCVNAPMTLAAYLGFVLIGDGKNAQRFEPLLDLLPHAYPLGPLVSNPDIWLVLTD